MLNPRKNTQKDWNTIISESNDNFAVLVDDTTTANVTYVGKAPIGAATSSDSWQIQKIDESSGTAIKWADGDDGFNSVWDNRASLTYQ